MVAKRRTIRVQRLLFASGLLLAVLSNPTVPRTDHNEARHTYALTLYGADAASVDRGSRDYRNLDQVAWKSQPGSTNQTAVVFGDPAKPGMYVTLLKRGPDNWSQPHAHPNDRYITVLRGTMLIGTGAKFDKKNTVAIGPGGMIRDVAGQMHYDGTGPDGLIIEIVGMGPTGRIEPTGKKKN
jgi:hypothetical protein